MSGATSAILFVENRDGPGVARIDPRARLAACLVFLAGLPLLTQPVALVGALLVGAAAIALARPPFRMMIDRLLMTEGFLLALLLTLPFILPGRPIVTLFWLSASQEGFWRAISIALRVNAGVLVILALLGGLGSTRLAAAMTGIGVPARLAQLLHMTVRYIGLFNDEYHRLRRAMRVRGFEVRSNRHSWRSLGNLLGMLLVRALERAERVRGAMVCRGFSGQFLAPEPERLNRNDYVFALAAVGAAFLLLLLETWS